MQLIRIFDGSFGGQTLYKNPEFVNPNKVLLELPLVVCANRRTFFSLIASVDCCQEAFREIQQAGAEQAAKEESGHPAVQEYATRQQRRHLQCLKEIQSYLWPNHLLCFPPPPSLPQKSEAARRDIRWFYYWQWQEGCSGVRSCPLPCHTNFCG